MHLQNKTTVIFCFVFFFLFLTADQLSNIARGNGPTSSFPVLLWKAAWLVCMKSDGSYNYFLIYFFIKTAQLKDYNFTLRKKNIFKQIIVRKWVKLSFLMLPSVFSCVSCVNQPSAWTSVCAGGAGARWAEGRRPAGGRTAWTPTDLCPPTRGPEDTRHPARTPGTGRPGTRPRCRLLGRAERQSGAVQWFTLKAKYQSKHASAL